MSPYQLDDPLAAAWPKDLAAILRRRFPIWILSSETPWFQLGFLDACLAMAGQDPLLARLAASLAGWMFQERPLEAKLAVRLAAQPENAAWLSPRMRAVAAMALAPLPADQAELYNHIDALGEADMLVSFLRAVLPLPGLGPVWLGRAFHLILRLPDADAALSLVASCALGPGNAALRDRFIAELAFHRLDDTTAETKAKRLYGTIFGPYGLFLSSMLAARSKRYDQGASLLTPLCKQMPWNVNAVRLLAGLQGPVQPAEREINSGDTVALVYTWNKAELLTGTLASLARSKLGACQVIVLDNGSTDATPEALVRAGELFAPDRYSVLTLPVNIGAPGARNWLLSLPQVKTARYAAFIDDDVILPEDWLVALRGAAHAHPRAGAVGCRIVDADPLGALQSADFNILPPDMGEAALDEVPERIFMCNNCAGLPDSGLFSYTRTCLSVSGCCHLINMEAVRSAGPFDVAFAPTQFDDLERDLRSWLAGFPSLYHGGLGVRHKQNSSLRQAETTAQATHIAGNKIKLESKFTDEQAGRLVAQNHETLWREYEAALKVLGEK